MNRTAQEVEIKLAVMTLSGIRARLRDAGLRIVKRRVFEANLLFDTADLRLRQARELIRIRRAGAHAILTYKGPPVTGGIHKSREEIEIEIGDPGQLERILMRLGYTQVFQYEKFRTEFGKPSEDGVVTVDETPIGNFLEIEGKPQWIDSMAKRLGFAKTDYITQSYGSLYIAYCNQRGIPPSNMIFPAKDPRKFSGRALRPLKLP